jgi:hypothetical protein
MNDMEIHLAVVIATPALLSSLSRLTEDDKFESFAP